MAVGWAVVMVVKKRYATGAWPFPNISVLQSIPLCCAMHQMKAIVNTFGSLVK
jgi:hypothetical protein